MAIGIAMFAGLLISRVVSRLNLPDVTSYLIAGVLVGPLVLGRLGVPGLGFTSFHFVESMGLICDAALGFIAFSIGSEFRVSALRKTGRQATVIAIFQALAATLFVDLALYMVHLIMPDKLTVPQLLTLGAIGLAIHIYLTSSAIWSSPVVSKSSGFVLLNFNSGIVLIKPLQVLKIYIIGTPFSSKLSL